MSNIKEPVYICEVHGEVTSGCVTMWTDDKATGEYCMECFKQLIRDHCKPVTRKVAA